MLQSLLVEIGGENVDSLSKVEVVKHHGPEFAEACFLRVNGTHAILLSEMVYRDDGSTGISLGYWSDQGLTLVAICCEELPVSWQRVETDACTLASWEPNPDIRYLSLKQLSTSLVVQPQAADRRHPLIDEFRRALEVVVLAEDRWREIPLQQWDQHAWRGFYKLLAAGVGGRLFMKPLGAGRHPYCRISLMVDRMELCLEDARFSVTVHGESPPLDKVFRLNTILEQASALGLQRCRHEHELKIVTDLIGEAPEKVHQSVTMLLLKNFLLLDDTGLVDFQTTIKRLVAARDLLTHDSTIIRPFGTVVEEMMLWLDNNTPPSTPVMHNHDAHTPASSPSDGTGSNNCQRLVERLLDHTLQAITVISPPEMHAMREVFKLHIAGMKTSHWNQFKSDPHEDDALQEVRQECR